MRRLTGLDEPEGGWEEDTEFWPRTSWREATLTFQILLASNFQVWPRGGGLFDQEEALVEDIMDLMAAHGYYSRLAAEARQLEQELKAGGQAARPRGQLHRSYSISELTGHRR